MRILIVGSQAAATLSELTAYGTFSDSDVLEIHTPPEGTPQYDMVIGDNCVRVYSNTIQFLKPFIKKAEEAAKAKPVDGAAVPKPKKKAASKKKAEPTIEIALPEVSAIEGFQYNPISASEAINNAIKAIGKKTDEAIMAAPTEEVPKTVWHLPTPEPIVETT